MCVCIYVYVFFVFVCPCVCVCMRVRVYGCVLLLCEYSDAYIYTCIQTNIRKIRTYANSRDYYAHTYTRMHKCSKQHEIAQKNVPSPTPLHHRTNTRQTTRQLPQKAFEIPPNMHVNVGMSCSHQTRRNTFAHRSM